MAGAGVGHGLQQKTGAGRRHEGAVETAAYQTE
jgi:hypothetical protein